MILFKKTVFRPITILPNLSKAFKLCLYDQIYEYTDNYFYDIIQGSKRFYEINQHAVFTIKK